MDRAIACLSLSVRTTMVAAQASVVALRVLVLVTALLPLAGVVVAAVAVHEASERRRRVR